MLASATLTQVHFSIRLICAHHFPLRFWNCTCNPRSKALGTIILTTDDPSKWWLMEVGPLRVQKPCWAQGGGSSFKPPAGLGSEDHKKAVVYATVWQESLQAAWPVLAEGPALGKLPKVTLLVLPHTLLSLLFLP